jgi:hypothetical protein
MILFSELWGIIVILAFLTWCLRLLVGTIWGVYRLKTTFYDANHWSWQDIIVCGPTFWSGWATGVGLRHFVWWLRAKKYERYMAKKKMPAAAEDIQE